MYLTVCTIKIDFYSLILENLFSHLAVNNLITSCLNVDEAERISLEQIENHEWLANLQVVNSFLDKLLESEKNSTSFDNDISIVSTNSSIYSVCSTSNHTVEIKIEKNRKTFVGSLIKIKQKLSSI